MRLHLAIALVAFLAACGDGTGTGAAPTGTATAIPTLPPSPTETPAPTFPAAADEGRGLHRRARRRPMRPLVRQRRLRARILQRGMHPLGDGHAESDTDAILCPNAEHRIVLRRALSALPDDPRRMQCTALPGLHRATRLRSDPDVRPIRAHRHADPNADVSYARPAHPRSHLQSSDVRGCAVRLMCRLWSYGNVYRQIRNREVPLLPRKPDVHGDANVLRDADAHPGRVREPMFRSR